MFQDTTLSRDSASQYGWWIDGVIMIIEPVSFPEQIAANDLCGPFFCKAILLAVLPAYF